MEFKTKGEELAWYKAHCDALESRISLLERGYKVDVKKEEAKK